MPESYERLGRDLVAMLDVIHSLVGTDAIARRLNISPGAARTNLRMLEGLGLVESEPRELRWWQRARVWRVTPEGRRVRDMFTEDSDAG